MATKTTSTGGKASMTVRLDRATLDAFDALAEGRGGRSALLRSLLDQAMRQAGDAPKVQARTERSPIEFPSASPTQNLPSLK